LRAAGAEKTARGPTQDQIGGYRLDVVQLVNITHALIRRVALNALMP
jgi:hypothetical protein